MIFTYYLYFCAVQVFYQKDGVKHVETCLTKLGMQSWLVRQVNMVFGCIQDLLTGVDVTQVMRNMTKKDTSDLLPSNSSLAQLLYAYLVQWIGEMVRKFQRRG